MNLNLIKEVVLQELVAMVKGFGHALVIPFVLFWVSFEVTANPELALTLMYSYLLVPLMAYEYYSDLEEGRWLRSQKYFYVGAISMLLLSVISILDLMMVP
jgi:hypothetical protein